VTIQSDAESSTPRRPNLSDQLGKPHVKTAARRFRWRAVIRSTGKLDPSAGHPAVAWHLADCSAPASNEAHCDVGRRLIGLDGNPDGHCLLDGVCPRCEEATAAVEATQVDQEQVEKEQVEQAAEGEAAKADEPQAAPTEQAAPSEVDEPRPAGA